MAFYPGGIGIIYKQFALTIAFSIAISAFNALSFSPMLSGLILPREKPPEPRGRAWIVVGVIVGLAFGRFSAAAFGSWTYLAGVGIGALAGANLPDLSAFNAGFDRLQRAYATLLTRVIALRQLILGGLAVGIVLTGFAFTALPTAFIPMKTRATAWASSNSRTAPLLWKPNSSACRSPRCSAKKTT